MTAGQRFEYLILFLILATVVMTTISTVKSIGEPVGFEVFEARSPPWPIRPSYFTTSCLGEAIVVIIFTFEWVARLYVAPEDDTTRCTYIFSFYSLVDLCAILPWCQTNLKPQP